MDEEHLCASSIDMELYDDAEEMDGSEAQGREHRGRNSNIWDQGW